MIPYLITRLLDYLIANAFYDEAEELAKTTKNTSLDDDFEKKIEDAGIKKEDVSDEISKIKKDERKKKYKSWIPSGEVRRRNFRDIEGTTNYRSAQPPLDKDFFIYLKEEYGIENILNLRSKVTSKSGESESQIVKDAGLNYEHIHLTSRPPTESQWERITALLNSGKTLVHCEHGADRTGAIAARYRIENQSVDRRDALNEALKYGFKPKTHPGYGSGGDPNRKLREWILK